MMDIKGSLSCAFPTSKEILKSPRSHFLGVSAFAIIYTRDEMEQLGVHTPLTEFKPSRAKWQLLPGQGA